MSSDASARGRELACTEWRRHYPFELDAAPTAPRAPDGSGPRPRGLRRPAGVLGRGFQGEQREVAQVVEDLQAASAEGDAARICSRILSRELVDRLSAGGLNCTDEIEKALADADEFELEVERVDLRGDTATAQVEDGKGRPQRIGLVRERGGWRADALATS